MSRRETDPSNWRASVFIEPPHTFENYGMIRFSSNQTSHSRTGKDVAVLPIRTIQ